MKFSPPSLPPSLPFLHPYLSFRQQNHVIKHGGHRAAWLMNGDKNCMPSLPSSFPPYLSLAEENNVIKHGVDRATWLMNGDNDGVARGAVVAELLEARHDGLGLEGIQTTFGCERGRVCICIFA